MTLSKIDTIEASIRDRIARGELPVGAMLPSRRNLSREFQVAIGTVERAVGRLIADGTLRADGGRGTFVAQAGLARSGVSAQKRSLPLAGAGSVLGILADYAHDYRVLTVARAIEQAYCAIGGTTRFYTQDRGAEGFQPLPDAVQAVLAGGAAALVIIGINFRPEAVEEVESLFQKTPVPTVYVGGQSVDTALPCVYYDSRDAGAQAMRALTDLGHRSVAFLCPFKAPWVEERWQGMQGAARHAAPETVLFRWPEQSEQTAWNTDQEESGYRASKSLLALPLLPTAVIAVNDLVAQGFLRAQAEGSDAARSVRVVGFDDTEEARLLGLTSLRPPLENLGTEAVRIILRALAGETVPAQVRLRSHLVARASTRPLTVSTSIL